MILLEFLYNLIYYIKEFGQFIYYDKQVKIKIMYSMIKYKYWDIVYIYQINGWKLRKCLGEVLGVFLYKM